MPTLLSERLRIIAAAVVASVLMLLTAKTSLLGYYFALLNWCPVAVLIVSKPYRWDFITAMLAVLLAFFVIIPVQSWLGLLMR